MRKPRFIASGLVAGIISTLVFMILHDVLISDIWFSAAAMLAAGGACGLALSWTFISVTERPNLRGWVLFNAFYVGSFVLLGIGSIIVFEPVTTIGELMAVNDFPRDLAMKALPFTFVFLVVMVVVGRRLLAGRALDYIPIAVTSVLLVALLGMNVSILGLIAIPSSSLYLVVELFLLILVLAAVFAAVVATLTKEVLWADES